MIIAINGLDGAGKTQQIKLLRFWGCENIYFAKPLIEYGSMWPKLTGCDMFDWWFKVVSIDDFMDIVVSALNERYLELKEKPVIILDRGTIMFKAVCVASMLVRDSIKINEAVKIVDKVFINKLFYSLDEEHNILMLPDKQYQKSIEKYLLFFKKDTKDLTPEDKLLYQRYQNYLMQAIDIYFDNKQSVKILVDKPICDIQNEIRAVIENMINQKLPKIITGIKQVIGFGGLSECGKSSFAEYLSKNKGYCRLKLSYLRDILDRQRVDVTFESMVMELFHFFQRHYYINFVSIESLHDPYVSAFLKLMLGSRFIIAYLDAPFTVRVKRTAIELGVSLLEAEKIITIKDSVKKSRGADIVGYISDIKFDNSENDHQGNIQRFSAIVTL